MGRIGDENRAVWIADGWDVDGERIKQIGSMTTGSQARVHARRGASRRGLGGA